MCALGRNSRARGQKKMVPISVLGRSDVLVGPGNCVLPLLEFEVEILLLNLGQ